MAEENSKHKSIKKTLSSVRTTEENRKIVGALNFLAPRGCTEEELCNWWKPSKSSRKTAEENQNKSLLLVPKDALSFVEKPLNIEEEKQKQCGWPEPWRRTGCCRPRLLTALRLESRAAAEGGRAFNPFGLEDRWWSCAEWNLLMKNLST